MGKGLNKFSEKMPYALEIVLTLSQKSGMKSVLL